MNQKVPTNQYLHENAMCWVAWVHVGQMGDGIVVGTSSGLAQESGIRWSGASGKGGPALLYTTLGASFQMAGVSDYARSYKIRRVQLVAGDGRYSPVFHGDEVGKRISYLHTTRVRDTVACHHGDEARLRGGRKLRVNACLGAFFCLPCYTTVLYMLSHVLLVPYLEL